MIGTGGLLALWSVAVLAIAGGRGLLTVIPVRTITLIGVAGDAGARRDQPDRRDPRLMIGEACPH
jgi:hypothetical protein